MKRFTLERTTKKLICPNCRKKTYVRFVDYNNHYLPEKYGRCDREDKCGYFLSPYKDGYAEDNPDPNYEIVKKVYIEPEVKTSYIPVDVVTDTLDSYELNHLFNFLSLKLGYFKALQAFETYKVGIYTNWCIFWQHDTLNQCRSGKYIKYKEDGHRDKDSATTWEHSRRNQFGLVYPEFGLNQCFFGEHLLPLNPVKPVAIVESEKTAIIASMCIDSYLWIACGSKSGLNQTKCEVLKNRSVTLFPDLGAYDDWKIKADERGYNISDHIEKVCNDNQRKNGYDLGDFLLNEL